MFMPNADGGPGQMFAGFFNNFLTQASQIFAPFLGQSSNGDPTTFINGIAQQLTQAFGQLTMLWSNTVNNQMQTWNHMGGRRNNNPDVEILTDSIERLERARSEMNQIEKIGLAILDSSKKSKFEHSDSGKSKSETSKLRIESGSPINVNTDTKMTDTREAIDSKEEDYMRSIMEHFENTRKLMDEVWSNLEPRLKELTSNRTVPFMTGFDINSDSVRNVMIDVASEMNDLWKLISARLSEEMANMSTLSGSDGSPTGDSVSSVEDRNADLIMSERGELEHSGKREYSGRQEYSGKRKELRRQEYSGENSGTKFDENSIKNQVKSLDELESQLNNVYGRIKIEQSLKNG